MRPEISTLSRILRPRQLAELLGISLPTLYRWLKRDGFPPKLRLGPGVVGWREEDVRSWLDELAKEDR